MLVGTASLETWSEPVTEIDQKFQLTLDYPDVYMCLPDIFVDTYSAPTESNNYYVAAGFGDMDYTAFQSDDESCDFNEYKGSFIKTNPLSMKPFGSDSSRASYVAANDPGSCPCKKAQLNTLSAAAPADSASRFRIGCSQFIKEPGSLLYNDDEPMDAADCGAFDLRDMETSADATKIALLMPRSAIASHGADDTVATDDDANGSEEPCENEVDEAARALCELAENCPGELTDCQDSADCAALIADGEPDEDLCAANIECQALVTCMDDASGRRRMQSSGTGRYEPVCMKYEMKPGSKQYYDEQRRYFMVTHHGVDEMDPRSPFIVMYLAEAGTSPYHCNNTERDGNNRCAINATAVFFPGFPSISIALLSIEYVRDLRNDPDAIFVPTYKYNMWNKMSVFFSSETINLKQGAVGFQYGASRRMMPSKVSAC
jgi:hypothetical protein